MKLLSAADLEQRILTQIPLLACMEVSIDSFDGELLTLRAPLAPNINDKSTAFGGSIVTLATITGWTMTTILAEHACGPADVLIVEQQMQFKHAITDNFYAQCTMPAPQLLDQFCMGLSLRGKASMKLEVRVMQQEKICAEFSGTYLARVH